MQKETRLFAFGLAKDSKATVVEAGRYDADLELWVGADNGPHAGTSYVLTAETTSIGTTTGPDIHGNDDTDPGTSTNDDVRDADDVC